MLTPFGRALRKHRIYKNISLREMAGRMDVAASFLSAVENGRKSIPENFAAKAAAALDLDLTQRLDLQEKADVSQKDYTISTGNKSDADRELVAVFARQFGGLDENEKREIMSILKGNRRE